MIDQYLLAFCKGVEECYGTNFVTPKMHLHAHIADCMLDYGPVHSFWLYSFEIQWLSGNTSEQQQINRIAADETFQ